MDLEKILTPNRVELNEINLTNVQPDNPADLMQVKGCMAERLVFQWLQRCGVEFDTGFPRNSKGHSWVQAQHGILVFKGKRIVHEYDFLVAYQGTRYVVEVKSLKLNGVAEKIPRALELASELYDGDVRMLLFFPMYTNKVADAQVIENMYPQVICVNIGYKKKQLSAAVQRFVWHLGAGR